jgi:hypothetical protein
VRFPGTRPNLPRRDIVDVHYAYDVVFAIAAPFKVGEQLILENLVQVGREEGWMDADFSLEISQEEHVGSLLYCQLLVTPSGPSGQ